MATPLLEALHAAYPKARIDLLLKPYLLGLLDGAPWLRRVIAIPAQGGTWELRGELARQRYDWGILLPNSLRPALLMFLARVRRRAGYVRNGRGPLLTDRLPFPGAQGKNDAFRMVDFYGRLGKALGIAGTNGPLRLYLTDQLREQAETLWRDLGVNPDARVIGLNPGAKYGSSKLWPVDHFAATGDALVEHSDARLCVLAGPGEDELANSIVERMRQPALTVPSERVPLAMLKAVIGRLSLLVTNDTGPRQIAAAMKVPSVTLFGPTHRTWGDTGSPTNIDISLDLECGPCMQRQCPLGHHKCLRNLAPSRVIEASLRLLEKG